MLEATILNYSPLQPVEIQLQKQMALFEKSHKEEYVFYALKGKSILLLVHLSTRVEPKP
jgi:hypothetical protein